mmetsp:Transcript_39571/g.114199  ORF Transcript_39571/g.114199 Transcript_39571/m.114199 type:complete len:220 (-) Transcript_39571:1850-2509(-)
MVLDCSLQVVQLGFEKGARHAWTQQLVDPFVGSQGPVGRAEVFIHDEVRHAGHTLCQLLVVLCLAQVEERVLQDRHVALGHAAHGHLDHLGRMAIRGEDDFLPHEFTQPPGHRLQRGQLPRMVLKVAQVGNTKDLSTPRTEEVNRGYQNFEPVVICHSVVRSERHIEVAAEPYSLARDHPVLEVRDALLCMVAGNLSLWNSLHLVQHVDGWKLFARQRV